MHLKVPAPLDPKFYPREIALREYEADVKQSENTCDFAVTILRNQGYCDDYSLRIFKDGVDKRTVPLLDRLVKTLLWARGGYKIVTFGSDEVHAHLKAAYQPGGERAFDADFMATVYERPFEVEKAETLADAEKTAAEVRRRMQDADAAAAEKLAQAQKAADDAARRQLDDARAQAERILTEAHAAARREHDKQLADAQKELEELAVTATEKLVLRSGGDAFDQFLNEAERSESHA